MIDLSADTSHFISEMQEGLAGRPQSLKMICTYIAADGEIPADEPVIVVDAGGTNFRTALVVFDRDRKPSVSYSRTYPMPGTQGEIGRGEFFRAIAEYIKPIIRLSSRIGFCFSYPTAITPERDGALIKFTKEVRVRDMEGILVGAGLKSELQDEGITDGKHIVLLNDSVATLLAGAAAMPGRRFSSYIGFILGTGTNTCYVEKNSSISGHPGLAGKPGSTIINIESCGYGGLQRGEFDLRVDRASGEPGAQQLEKMISGFYIGKVLLAMLHQAAAEELFTPEAAGRISRLSVLTAKDIDDFCLYPSSDGTVLGRCINGADPGADEQNQLTLYDLADALFERAARITAVTLAAAVRQSGQGTNPCYPVLITAEGTAFYKAKLFRGKLDYYVSSFLNRELGLYCEFARVEDATLIGTAIAGLTNG